MLDFLFLASGLVFGYGVYLASRLAGTVLNPFGLMFLIFSVEIGILVVDPFNSSPVPGSVPTYLLCGVVAGAGVSMLVGMILGLRGVERQPRAGYPGMRNIGAITVVFCTAALLSLADLIVKSGGAPLLLMGQRFAEGEGALYSDYFSSLFMYGLGFARVPAIILAADYGSSGLSLRQHLRRNRVWYFLTLLTSLLMVLGGQRNCLFIAILILAAASFRYSDQPVKSVIRMGLALLALGWIFTFIGNLRLGVGEGSQFGLFSYLKGEIPENAFTRSLVWLPVYLGHALFNLNAELLSSYEPMMGQIALMKTVPDALLPYDTVDQEMIMDYLEKAGLMPLPGQTFRTFMGDIYADFDVAGAILVPGLMVWLAAAAYRRATVSLRWSVLYFSLVPGVALMPFIDYFSGAQNLVAIFSVVLLSWLSSRSRGLRQPAGRPAAAGLQPGATPAG